MAADPEMETVPAAPTLFVPSSERVAMKFSAPAATKFLVRAPVVATSVVRSKTGIREDISIVLPFTLSF
jgi:hypothetical protein